MTSPADTVSVVLSAPFALATNLLGTGGARPGYTGRALPALTTPIRFRMTELPAATLPAPIPANLEQSIGIAAHVNGLTDKTAKAMGKSLKTDVESITDDLNILSTQLSQSAENTAEVQRLNRLSLITINYSVVDRPVELSTPP